MSQIFFIVGPPGAGKTSIIRHFIEEGSKLFAPEKWTVGPTVCAAGHYTGEMFDGADTVPYNGAAACLALWEGMLTGKALTILDGDRFSNAKVMDWFTSRGHQVVVGLLDPPDEVVEARRLERGSKQNPTWLKGRGTKARRFHSIADEANRFVIPHDTTPEEAAAFCRAQLEERR